MNSGFPNLDFRSLISQIADRKSKIGDNLRFVSCVCLVCLLIGSFAGCGDDEIGAGYDANELARQGWLEYSAGNYEDAIDKYQEALDLEDDSVSSEAYNGIGWARARLGQSRDSIDSFKKSVTKDPANADAHAGLAGVYLADSDYEQAIAAANLVLSINPDYESHHDDIKAADIRILLAECYYNMGDYTAAKAQIDLLGSSGKTLNPDSTDYLADLLSLIEELAGRPKDQA
jgi:tetratricopeptide (TPR) repeat protein